MHVLRCPQVRDDIAAYHDHELPLERQILIESHLQECVACRLEAMSLAELSATLREMTFALPDRGADDIGQVSGAVLDRLRVERRYAFGSRCRVWFEDMHLVWAGLGATTAMLFCIFASAGVLQAASRERSDSLAGIISTIASGSTQPIRLLGTAYENQPLLDTTAALSAGHDTGLMLSAIVTPEGRLENVAVFDEDTAAGRVRPQVVRAMIAAASRARFTPLDSSASARTVSGMNVVWLMTSTTVVGLPNHDLYLLSPPRVPRAAASSKTRRPAVHVSKPASAPVLAPAPTAA